MNISKSLIELRTELNLIKTEMARRIGVSIGAYANWEYGNRTPNYGTLLKIAKIFNLSINYFHDDIQEKTHKKINSFINKYHLDQVILPREFPSTEVTNILSKLMDLLRFDDYSSIVAISKISDTLIDLLDADNTHKNSVTDESYLESKKEINQTLDEWRIIQKNNGPYKRYPPSEFDD